MNMQIMKNVIIASLTTDMDRTYISRSFGINCGAIKRILVAHTDNGYEIVAHVPFSRVLPICALQTLSNFGTFTHSDISKATHFVAGGELNDLLIAASKLFDEMRKAVR